MSKQQLYFIVDGYATTTDGATQIALVTFDTSTGAPGGTALNNCTIFINGTATGFNSGSGAGSAERVAAAFKVNAGTLAQIGSTTHVSTMLSNETPAPNTGFSVSGTVITYWAVGSASQTINWLGRMDLHIYQNS